MTTQQWRAPWREGKICACVCVCTHTQTRMSRPGHWQCGPCLPPSLRTAVPISHHRSCHIQGITEVASLISPEPMLGESLLLFHPHQHWPEFQMHKKEKLISGFDTEGSLGPSAMRTASVFLCIALNGDRKAGDQACSCQLGYLFFGLNANFLPARLCSI